MYLKLGDEKASKNAMLKDPYASKHKVVLIRKVDASIKINKNSSGTFKRTQFQLTFARACTVQKVQGFTLHKTPAFGVGEAKNFHTRSNLCFPIMFNILIKIKYTF